MTNRAVRYAAACAALTIVGVLLCWPLLDGSGRMGTLTAAALALPLQVGAFTVLHWGWSKRSHFLMAWAVGMLARLTTVGFALILVLVSDLPPAPTLLALASFFFLMLLIEPFFLRGDSTPAVRS